MKTWIVMTLLCLATLNINGCATVDTISNAKPGSAKFFSGTRLDINALAGNNVAIKKFEVQPPKYPLLDLPASFMLDLIIAPMTAGVALYEVVFE